jgi:5,10-methenyltetrahydrofolate synthetase
MNEGFLVTIPDDIGQWRKAQRAQLLARRVAATVVERRQWSEIIERLLLEAFPALRTSVVGFYWPFQGEFDPRSAIRRLREQGARAALPVVAQKAAPLEFREWWPGAPMARGVFDLPVPDGTEVLRPEALLIPPVGFDTQGYRLGYGGGYFDRTLAAAVPQPLKIGVGFELSRMPTIRPQPHDMPMDFIVTESGVHCVTRNGLEPVRDLERAAELASAIVRDRERKCLENEEGTESERPVVREYSSPPCYAHEIDPAYKDM